MELSWKLRPASSGSTDKFYDCDSKHPPGAIRLHWIAGGIECSKAWHCEDLHGTTGFDLDEGIAQLWVTPDCSRDLTPTCTDRTPAAPDTYIAPALVERNVIRGEVVSLGAVELVVSVSNCASEPCICAQ